MPKPAHFKITGDDFDDFAPVVHDKDWVVTTPAADKDTIDGILASIELEGHVAVGVGSEDDVDDEDDDHEGVADDDV